MKLNGYHGAAFGAGICALFFAGMALTGNMEPKPEYVEQKRVEKIRVEESGAVVVARVLNSNVWRVYDKEAGNTCYILDASRHVISCVPINAENKQ